MENQRKIKILEAIRQGQIGGGETHVFDLVKTIDKEKFEVEVLSFTDGVMVDKLKALGIKVHIIKTEKPFDVRCWNKVTDLMKQNQFDIIHAHGTRAASNVFYSANKLKLPLMYTVHGWSFHNGQNPVVRRVRELSEKFLTSRANLTIAVSNSNQYDGQKKFGLKRSTVIYNGIDGLKFNPTASYKDIRAELNIPQNKTLVTFLARMTYQKDPLTMVRAMKEVVQTTKDVTCLMVGGGEMLEETKNLVNELGLNEHVLFSDFRNDVPDILNASDIYCLPSLWEGLPIGLLEAMFMKKACIATGVDGTNELISHGKNGLLIPIKNHRLLAKAILDIHQDQAKGLKIAERASVYAKENFGLNAMVNKIEKVYLQYSIH